MIILDGSQGEGGGQILRTALALSMITKKPFRIENIRKNRQVPGLKAQHLAGIKALQHLSDAAVDGAKIGCESLLFAPKKITRYRAEIDIGTAGPITLVLQTIIPPLIFAEKESRIKITGGTDVSWSPQMDYFINVILPQLERFADIRIKIEKRGYYPKGGGKIELIIKPRKDAAIMPFELISQSKILYVKGVSHASKDLINSQVAERQARAARLALSLPQDIPIMIKAEYADTESIGSGVTLFAGFSKNDELSEKNPVILGADSLGERSKKSEDVGQEAAKKLLDEIKDEACVDAHNLDNLIPYLAMAGGRIKSSKITEHTRSNIFVTEKFFDVRFDIDEKTNTISCSSVGLNNMFNNSKDI